MTGTNANVQNYTSARVLTAILGSTAPTDLTTGWVDAWKDCGYIDQDQGVELAATWTSTDHREYSGGIVLTTSKDEKHTAKWTSIEENLIVLGLLNPGGSASTTSEITTVNYFNHVPNPRMFGLEFQGPGGTVIDRWVFARGDITDPPAALKRIKDGIDMFEITMTAQSVNGQYATRLTNSPGLAS